MYFFSHIAGNPSISRPIDFTLNVAPFADSYDPFDPEFNLTCNCTGGHAAWTYNGNPVPSDDENVLTVKGNKTGSYHCSVGNCSQELCLHGNEFFNTKCKLDRSSVWFNSSLNLHV